MECNDSCEKTIQFNLLGIQEVRGERRGTTQAKGKGNENHEFGTFFERENFFSS
jgi:hypothetical protein